MARYKKKKHNKILNPPKKRVKPPVKQKKSEDIVMTKAPSKKTKTEPKKTMRVVAGKKGERETKFKVLTAVAVVLVAFVLLLEVIFPAGIIQTLSNTVATIGAGNFPIAVTGSETLDVVPFNNYFFHLTDTHISAYSTGGKTLFSLSHGYEKPVLAVSNGKVLLYNQGGEEASIYDLKGLKHTVKTKQEIICADISDSGCYAITTYSDSYAAAVSVYNKRNKVVYEWYSAEDVINNVAISASGKKIAVSTFNSTSGTFDSKVNVINFKTATPEYTQKFDNQIIYGLKSSNNSTFCIIKSNGIDYVKWNNHKTQSFSEDYNIYYLRMNKGVNVAVFSRESDKTDNRIVIFSKRGRVKTTVKYNGIINDIQVKGSNIYCINDTEVTVLDFKGNVKHTANYGFGGNGLSVISANVVAVVTDSEIKRVKV